MYRLNIPYILIHNEEYNGYDRWCYNSIVLNPNLFWFEFSNLDLSKIIYENNKYASSPNITWDTIINNPTYKWNYSELSQRSDLTWDIVKANPQIPWDYAYLSANPTITWDIIKNNPDKKWDYYWLSYNPNITWNIVQDNPQIEWDYKTLTKNIKCPLEVIKQHGHIHDIARHKDISIEYILNYYKIDKIIDINNKHLCYGKHDIPYSLSINPNLTLDIIRNINIAWEYREIINNIKLSFNDLITGEECRHYELSWYSGITLDDIYNNQHLHWNYKIIHLRGDLTWDYIQSHPNFPWDYTLLSNHTEYCGYSFDYNHNIKCYGLKYLRDNTNYIVSWKDIMNNTNKPWDYDGLSARVDLTIKFVKEYPRIPWNYNIILGNPNIDQDGIMYIVNNYINKTYLNGSKMDHCYSLSLNPNLTWRLIIELDTKYRCVFYTQDIIANLFNQHPHLIKKRRMRKYFNRWKATVIKYKKEREHWNNIYYCVIHEYKLKFGIICY